MRYFVLSLLILAACSQPQPEAVPQSAPAPAAQTAPIAVSEAWALPSPGGASVAAGYMQISAGASADRLIGATSPRAGHVEIHTMETVAGVMQMRQVDGLDVPANGSVALAQGGDHLMFIDVTAPFTEGEDIPVELTFANAGVIPVTLPVRRPSMSGGHGEGH
ncbi:MAG: copper chaperone PCu(A)C [Hyphomonadaceae bacterium]